MSDPLTWSPISLGRWFGTTVKVHIFLILFVAIELLMALLATSAEEGLRRLPQTACWLSLLLLALVIHELGHALTRLLAGLRSGGCPPLAAGQPGRARRSRRAPASTSWSPWPGRSPAVPCSWASPSGLNLFAGAHVVWNPFGNVDEPGVALDAPRPRRRWPPPLTPIWILGWFGYLNYLLFLVNLLPALPFDGGRMFRAYLSSTSVVSARDNIYAPWTARATAAILFLIGLVRLLLKATVPTASR